MFIPIARFVKVIYNCQKLFSLSSTILVCFYAFGANEDPTPPTEDDFSLHLPSIALTGSPALFNFLIASFVLGDSSLILEPP